MAKPKINLFFDPVSPFSYMAMWALENLESFRSCERVYTPIFLGALMNATKNTPPIQIINKGKWINADRLRWCRLFGIPMQPETPKDFPPRTLTTQRALTALAQTHPQHVAAAGLALHAAHWAEHQRIAEPDVIEAVLTQIVGAEVARECLQRAGEKDVKDLLAQRTQEAFDSGAFGLPWYQATNAKGETECFWGFDHLGQLAAFLDLEKPTHGPWKSQL